MAMDLAPEPGDLNGAEASPLGDEPSGPLDEFETEIRAAFPDNDWTPDRVMAMKEAIRLCLEQDKEGGYDDKPPPKKGGDAGLALIFEGPKKKGS
jgi:hypothetical protein